MNKGKAVLLILAALVCVSLGFVVGQVVQATGNQPGSENDPLVSQSYVEKVLGEKMSVLQTKIDELEAEVSQLKGGGTVSGNSGTDTSSGNDTTGTANTNTGKMVQVTSDNVNIREKPSTDSAKIGSANKSTKLKYLGEQDGWYKVQVTDSKVGWIADYLCKLVNE